MIEITSKDPENTVKKSSVKELRQKLKENEEEKNKNRKSNYLHRFEEFFEKTFYRSRWLLAPMYIFLIVVLIIILFKFFEDIWQLAYNILILKSDNWIPEVLDLLDLTLIANLVIIVAFSGYENFVSKIDYAHEYGVSQLPWMGSLDFSELKLKIIGSVVAISIIELLKDFLSGSFNADVEYWRIVLHIVFVVTGVVFASMEILESKKSEITAKTGLIEKEKDKFDKI